MMIEIGLKGGVRHRRARGRRAKWADCELIRCDPCPDAALDGGGI